MLQGGAMGLPHPLLKLAHLAPMVAIVPFMQMSQELAAKPNG
jgi:hydrogenase/urease accessory protein HupE